ncbi:dTDP-4-dehydrorhamnose reductase [Rhodobacteraceae bacterium KMM 6894]|nr:dTDP-4-dehydrorhamnose reductase [Rhodobacteraceae bacterium KMM 6894]
MTLLVFGKTGQVAQELQAQGDVVALGRDAADLSDLGAVEAAIAAHAPRAVINAAAYTAVDRAEDDEALAHAVNAVAPGAMARACAARGIPLVHISTDYVFAGGGLASWKPDDTPDPQNVYGHTKLAGENAVRAVGGVHVILRTSWVFSAHGANFVKTMLRLSESRDALNIVGDQIGGPTPAADIAAAVLKITTSLEGGTSGGTYHFSGAPDVNWADFAREIFRQAGRDVTVTDIPTADYPTPARRPLNSRLDCTTLTTDFGLSRPDWRAGLADVLAQLTLEGFPE